jgi:hypothetical protein
MNSQNILKGLISSSTRNSNAFHLTGVPNASQKLKEIQSVQKFQDIDNQDREMLRNESDRFLL